MAGSKATNTASIDFQKQQAAQADLKEQQRQAALNQGTNQINQIFGGTPVMGTRSQGFDWSTYQPPTPAQSASGRSFSAGAPTPATPGGALPEGFSYAAGGVVGPDGTFHPKGSSFNYNASYDTGARTGGFSDDYYNNYRQNFLNLNQPEEQRQFDMAKRDLTYNLARGGLMNSSVAADKTGELAYQDAINKAKTVSDADTATAALRSQVDQQKQAAINQLYATNDPSLAANLAESSAKGLQLQNPTLTPSAALFDPALSAVGTYTAAQTSPYNAVNAMYGGYGYGANPMQSGPAPASASQKSGGYVL